MQLRPMFVLAVVWAKRTGNTLRVVSGNDHAHSRNSMHYENRALDFWSSDSDALNHFLQNQGYETLWRVPGHYAHVHAEIPQYLSSGSTMTNPFLPKF